MNNESRDRPCTRKLYPRLPIAVRSLRDGLLIPGLDSLNCFGAYDLKRVCWFLLVVLVVELTPSNPAISAERCYPSFFCVNCEIALKVAKNTQCIIPLRSKSDSGSLATLDIVDNPANGKVGIDKETRPTAGRNSKETKVIYLPNRDFTGADSFSIRDAVVNGAKTTEGLKTFKVDVFDPFEKTEAGAELTVSYLLAEEELSPKPGHHENWRQDIYRLHGRNSVDFVRIWNGNKQAAGNFTLGTEVNNLDAAGNGYTFRSHIVDGGIVLETLRPSYTLTRRFKLTGRSSCAASVEYKLNPGHDVFDDTDVMTNQPIKLSSKRGEHVTCTIAAIR
jgi:hypothetical protein